MERDSIFFIGGGNMASAIIAGMDRKSWRICVAEISSDLRTNLQERFQIETVENCDDPVINVYKYLLIVIIL
jgi:pyrroline-5-carboxylate reductase